MSLSNLDSGAPHSSSEYDVEYRSKTDDAWYSVRTLLNGEKLTVIYKDHSFVNGEERCMCTFVVIWEHGPIFGCLANKKVENICVIRSNTQLDPKVAKFSKIVMDRLESAAYEPNLPSSCGTPHEDIASLPVKLDSTFSHRFSQASVSCIIKMFWNLFVKQIVPANLRVIDGHLKNNFQHEKRGISNDLKVVYSGSEEYRIAKQLRDLFMEFSEHQQQLHKRLALEEQKILQRSLTL
ncbi:hypothetical protein GH714_023082 [Hevea brasiliensis]|uniref:Uncharacterized protein n=1 Tax=Hevea brasiliensis TaxID=3981 RepID=A0A6A6KTX9_HEVBR|nr:hypothetical protein GH714_023082 [Hevea brasiliensis]